MRLPGVTTVISYKLTSLGSDEVKLTISPDVRSWYGVPSGEQIDQAGLCVSQRRQDQEGKAAGGADIFVTLNESVFTPTAPVVQARPANVKDGINYLNDNSVTLVLYAPGKSHVHLMGDFNNWTKDNAWQLFKDGGLLVDYG